MKCDKCGYDDNGSGDTAHACTFYQSLSQPVKTPQRTWVGLSVFEINDLVENTEYEDYRDLVERTEAKLKEKNT